MFRVFLFTVLVCLFASILWAQSQRPILTSNGSGEQPQEQISPTQQKPENGVKTNDNSENTEKASDSPSISVPIVPPDQKQEIPNDNGEQSADKRSESCVLLGYNIKITDGLLALFTLALVIFTEELARVTKRQYRLTKENFVSSQRAFVFLKDFHTAKVRDPINKQVRYWKLTPVWGNSGYTPTNNLVICINYKVFEAFEKEIPEGFAYPYESSSEAPMVIGPKSEVCSKPFIVWGAEIFSVMQDTGHLYIWGYAEYHDIFKGSPKRHTRFCFKLFIDNTLGEPMVENASFFQYGKYNYAD